MPPATPQPDNQSSSPEDMAFLTAQEVPIGPTEPHVPTRLFPPVEPRPRSYMDAEPDEGLVFDFLHFEEAARERGDTDSVSDTSEAADIVNSFLEVEFERMKTVV